MNTASPDTLDFAPKDLPLKTGPFCKYGQFLPPRLVVSQNTHSDGQVGSVMRHWCLPLPRRRNLARSIGFDICKSADLQA